MNMQGLKLLYAAHIVTTEADNKIVNPQFSFIFRIQLYLANCVVVDTSIVENFSIHKHKRKESLIINDKIGHSSIPLRY